MLSMRTDLKKILCGRLPGAWALTLTTQKQGGWALTQEWALTRDTTVYIYVLRMVFELNCKFPLVQAGGPL